MPSAAEGRSELVHHTYMHARGRLLGTLAREGRLDSVKLGTQARRNRDQKRR
jgi:hypothetical protein